MNLINTVLLKSGILKDIAKSPIPEGVKWFEHVTKSELILAGIVIGIVILIAIVLKSRYNRWREKTQNITSVSSINVGSDSGSDSDSDSDSSTSSESTIASIDRIISSGKGLEYINGLGATESEPDADYNGFNPSLY
jgi:hypothetical protein